jgi:hypothetical protein
MVRAISSGQFQSFNPLTMTQKCVHRREHREGKVPFLYIIRVAMN